MQNEERIMKKEARAIVPCSGILHSVLPDSRSHAPLFRLQEVHSALAFGLPLNGVLLGFIAFVALAANAFAHPVPKSNHDRTVRVQLVPGEKPGDLTVRVAYRLEVDETTVVLDDIKPFQDQIDPAAFKGQPLGYYAEYMRIYAPILGRHLVASIDGRGLEFKSVGGTPSLKDEDGKDLGHLRCDFVFEAPAAHPVKGAFSFDFREGSFLLQEGDIRLSL